MLEILAEMQLKLDTITENVEKLEGEKLEKRRLTDESIKQIEGDYTESIAYIDLLIRENKTEHSNITYSISIAKSVAAHYEAKAEDKLTVDSEATAELKEADDTGGIKPEDWVNFCAKTCHAAPKGVELPEDDTKADQEGPEEGTEPAQPEENAA